MAALRRFVIAALLCSSVLRAPASLAVAAELSEYQLKAAFLANFAKFVEWPAQSLPEGNTPVLIAVVGDDPFGRDLDDTIKGKMLQGHPMVVKRVQWRDDITRFHIAFISTSDQSHLAEIFRRLESANVLTVSDIEGFCGAGGMIAFVMSNERVRFEVNADAAQRRGLKISSKLLSLATHVHTKGN